MPYKNKTNFLADQTMKPTYASLQHTFPTSNYTFKTFYNTLQLTAKRTLLVQTCSHQPLHPFLDNNEDKKLTIKKLSHLTQKIMKETNLDITLQFAILDVRLEHEFQLGEPISTNWNIERTRIGQVRMRE